MYAFNILVSDGEPIGTRVPTARLRGQRGCARERLPPCKPIKLLVIDRVASKAITVLCRCLRSGLARGEAPAA